MNEKKYLSDGRKVVVIGSINKTEYIVQEVYVTEDGSEIPSGENFTAKNLLDQPALSWKDKEVEKLEDRLKKVKNETSSIEKELHILKQQRLAHSHILQSNEKFIKMWEGFDTEFMADVLTGNVKYVMNERCSYSLFEVQTFEEGVYRWYRPSYREDKKLEGIKLISIMGITPSSYSSDRKLRTSISSYEDGSGGSRDVLFFKDEESVRKELTSRMYSKLEERKENSTYGQTLSSTEIDQLEKWIAVPEDIKNASREEELKKAKDNYQKSIKDAEERYNKVLQEINNETK